MPIPAPLPIGCGSRITSILKRRSYGSQSRRGLDAARHNGSMSSPTSAGYTRGASCGLTAAGIWAGWIVVARLGSPYEPYAVGHCSASVRRRRIAVAAVPAAEGTCDRTPSAVGGGGTLSVSATVVSEMPGAGPIHPLLCFADREMMRPVRRSLNGRRGGDHAKRHWQDSIRDRRRERDRVRTRRILCAGGY